VLTLIYLAVICWLPGAAIFRVPALDRDRRARLPAEERAFWAVVISVAVSLALTLGLAALHRYSLERLVAADLLVALGAAALARGRLRLPGSPRVTLAALVPLALVALGAWRFFPPSEYIIGGKDPGVYMNAGIQIAQRGSLVIRDDVVASVPPVARDLFFPSHERSDYYSVRFMGFWIQDPEAGTVVSQFPHLYSASIAIGYGLDGLTGARRTTGVWAILGLLAVYFAGARVFAWRAAAVAAILLSLHVVEVWFARYPNAEVVMQALLFAALLASARAHVDADPFFAPVAGVLLGLLLFLRLDAVVAAGGMFAGVLALRLAGTPPRWWMMAAFGAAAILAVPYMLGPLRGYIERPIVFAQTRTWWQYLAAALIAGAALWAATLGARHPRLRTAVVRWLPIACATALAAAGLYALFLRTPAGKLAAHDAYALRTYANFYVTVPAVLAALAGYALSARRAFWRAPGLFLTVAIFGVFFFYKIWIVPQHFWMARRFVPVVLPATMLFIAALAIGERRRFVRHALGFVFVALLAAQYARAARPVLAHVEYAGLIPRIEQLAAAIGDEDLLVAESVNAGSDVHVIALPLAYIYARPVLLLHSAKPDKAVFGAFLEWAATRYRRVLFLGSGGTDLLSHGYGVRALSSERFQVPEYETPENAYPRGVRRKEFDFGLYEFTPPDDREGTWFDLDVGIRDDLHVLRFHAKEESAGRTFRWTQDRSLLSVTVVAPESRTVTLWMNSGGRPEAAPPADVTVSFDGHLLGTRRVGDGFAPYALAIPPEVAAAAAAKGAPVELRLESTVWNPRAVLGAPDDRDLGVMLDRVTVK
jgi:hypothetical protein